MFQAIARGHPGESPPLRKNPFDRTAGIVAQGLKVERLPKLAHHTEGSVAWRYRYRALSALAFSMRKSFLKSQWSMFFWSGYRIAAEQECLHCASTCRVDDVGGVGLTRRHATTLSDLDLLVSPASRSLRALSRRVLLAQFRYHLEVHPLDRKCPDSTLARSPQIDRHFSRLRYGKHVFPETDLAPSGDRHRRHSRPAG